MRLEHPAERNTTAPVVVGRQVLSACRSRPASASQAKPVRGKRGIHFWLARVYCADTAHSQLWWPEVCSADGSRSRITLKDGGPVNGLLEPGGIVSAYALPERGGPMSGAALVRLGAGGLAGVAWIWRRRRAACPKGSGT